MSFLCVKLGDSVNTTHGKLQQTVGDAAISRDQMICDQEHKPFAGTKRFLKAKPL